MNSTESHSFFKVYQTAFNKDNSEYIKKVFIFIGEQPKTITNILALISKGQKINKEQEKLLAENFGKTWRKKLGLEELDIQTTKLQKIHKKSFKIMRGGKEKISSLIAENLIDVADDGVTLLEDYFGGADESAAEGLDVEYEERMIDESVYPETVPEETEEDYAQEKDKITMDDFIVKSETIEDDEDELQKLIEEIDEEEVIESELTSKPTVPLDIQLRIEVSNIKYNFVPTLIYPDDNVETLKKKISVYSGIPLIAQHVYYIRENPYFEGDLESVNFEYSIVNIKDKTKIYDSSILNLYKTKTERSVLGIPIDDTFIKLFENMRVLLITDKRRNLIGTDNRYEIYVTSFIDIISFIDKAKIRDILIDDPSELYDFYNGFVLKYFPSIINSQGSLIALLLNEYKLRYNPGSLIKDFQKEQLQTTTLNNAKKIEESPIKILSISITINYPSDENIISKKRILNLRNLFDFYQPSNDVPYIKYKDKEQGYVLHKAYRKFYEDNPGIVRGRWALTEPTGLVSFKVRQNKNKFATISVFDDGKVRIDSTWDEVEAATIKQVYELVDIVNEHIIDKINDLELNVFISRRRINKEHVKIVSMNVVSNLKTQLSEYDYKNLTLITRVFKNYINLDMERKVDFEKNIFSVYWRYLKSSKVQYKGFRGRAISHNEIISNDNRPPEEFIYGTDIHIVEKEPKLFISGAKDFDEINKIYEFVREIIGIYKSWIDPKYKSENILRKEFEQYNKLLRSPDEEEGKLKLSKRKQVKRIRKLQASDPKLFDFEARKGKFQFYSRICQGEDRQPLIVTKEEAEKLPKSRLLEIDNKSKPGLTNIYHCDNSVYKYPGLFQKEKHPEGYCLPCCFKTDFRDISTPRNYRIFKQCMRDQTSVTTTVTSEEHEDRLTMNRYVKQWNKPIEEGRFGLLPITLQDFLNADLKCRINRLSMIERNSKCFLTIGVLQDDISFLRTVASSTIPTSNVILNKNERMEVNNFQNKIIKYLKENLYLFQILQNGKVKREFETLDKFINYLRTKFISDEFTLELLSKYNPVEPINIILLKEQIDGSIRIQCKESTYNLIENLEDPSKKTIIIIKNEVKKQYFPIYFIETDSSPIPKIHVKRYFRSDDNVIKKIIKLIRNVCEISENPIKMKQTYMDLYGVNLMIDSKFIPPKPYDIIGQILAEDQHTIQAIIIENKKTKSKFTFPIKFNSLQLANVPIKKDSPLGSYDEIVEFLDKISHDTELKIRKLITFKNKIIAIMLNSNYFIFIKPFDVKNNKRKDLELYEMKYDINKINKYIFEDTKIDDIRVVQSRKIKFDKDVFNTMVLELSHIIFNERNKNIRDKIKKIVHKDEKMTGNNYREIIDNISKIPNLSMDDINQLKELVQQYFITKNKKEFDKDFREFAFDFDHEIKKGIVDIVNNHKISNKEKTKKIRSIIEEIIKPIIVITNNEPKIDKTANLNIIQQCTDKKNKRICPTPQCLWSESDSRCKIIMPKNLYENYMIRLSDELAKNDYMRLQVLNNAVDVVLDRERFLTKPDEYVFMTPIKR